MKKIIVIFILFFSNAVFAQEKASSNKALLKTIRANVRFAKDFNFQENLFYNIDSLCQSTSKKIVKLLSKTSITPAQCKYLGLELSIESKDKSGIKIYTFGYFCGGTSGYISQPVIQWKNESGQLFAYNFSKIMNAGFYEIHPLKCKGTKLYALIGQEKGDGGCNHNIVYVIALKDSYLITDYLAFTNRPYIYLCNVEFNFNEQKQSLSGKLLSGYQFDRYKESVKNQEKYSNSLKDNERLLQLLGYYDDRPPKAIQLKFDGKKFIR